MPVIFAVLEVSSTEEMTISNPLRCNTETEDVGVADLELAVTLMVDLVVVAVVLVADLVVDLAVGLRDVVDLVIFDCS